MTPDFRFMAAHPAHWIALGFGSGLVRVAPGTFGTLAGWASFALLAPRLDTWGATVVLVGGFALGVWACQKTRNDLGTNHGAMVWDEIVAIWLVLLFVPWGLIWQVAAFAVFRFFDIVKPPPIPRFERRFASRGWAGFGMMGDDLIAAFYTLLTIAVGVRLFDRFSGA